MADALRRNLREVDLVGRWGGEEFLVLCGDTEEVDALKVGEKLRAAIAALPSPAITVSIGVATWRSGEEIKSVLSRADQRLYHAKALGRNRVAASDL